MDHDEIGQLIYDRVFGRAPKHAWFRRPSREENGPIFGWLTEPIEGKWGSMVWWPKGPGSRSNKAERWELVEDLTGVHDARHEAKARALRLYRAYYDHGCTLAQLLDGSYLKEIR